ncbi:DUF3574 domain-containing protein [Microbulbifer sp. SA54]|uniref:DUF3574 domain-containing protein n=1 Tax=Microbulbifer sp. SA54 TaxID=3401577 RepID=UPI003AAC5918
MRNIILIGYMVAGFGLTACTTPLTPSSPLALTCRTGETPQVYDQLFFGTKMPDGDVDDDAWRAFLQDTITPRFPRGLTVLSGAGQWQSGTGDIIHEPSYILLVVHPGNRTSEKAIAEVMQAYKTQFAQQAVLRLRNHTCVSF